MAASYFSGNLKLAFDDVDIEKILEAAKARRENKILTQAESIAAVAEVAQKIADTKTAGRAKCYHSEVYLTQSARFEYECDIREDISEKLAGVL